MAARARLAMLRWPLRIAVTTCTVRTSCQAAEAADTSSGGAAEASCSSLPSASPQSCSAPAVLPKSFGAELASAGSSNAGHEATPEASGPPPSPAARTSRLATLMIKELKEGEGEAAATGMIVNVHYLVRLLGDGTVIEDTRSSGYGDRPYGSPYRFVLGDIEDRDTLRALHACALDMHVGGRRRVRTSLLDEHFGYRQVPQVRDEHWTVRQLEPNWLIDVEVTLVSVTRERPRVWAFWSR